MMANLVGASMKQLPRQLYLDICQKSSEFHDGKMAQFSESDMTVQVETIEGIMGANFSLTTPGNLSNPKAVSLDETGQHLDTSAEHSTLTRWSSSQSASLSHGRLLAGQMAAAVLNARTGMPLITYQDALRDPTKAAALCTWAESGYTVPGDFC